jgi:hypothetical protein
MNALVQKGEHYGFIWNGDQGIITFDVDADNYNYCTYKGVLECNQRTQMTPAYGDRRYSVKVAYHPQSFNNDSTTVRAGMISYCLLLH